MDLRWVREKAPDTTPRGTHPNELAVALTKPAEDGPRLKTPEEMQRRPSELTESTSDILMKLMETRASVVPETSNGDAKPPAPPPGRVVLQPMKSPAPSSPRPDQSGATRPSQQQPQQQDEAAEFAEVLNLQPLQPLQMTSVEGHYVDIPSVTAPTPIAPKPLPSVPVFAATKNAPQRASHASILSAPPIKENPQETEYGAIPLQLPSEDEALVTPPTKTSYMNPPRAASPRVSPRHQQLSLTTSTLLASIDQIRQPRNPPVNGPPVPPISAAGETLERAATIVQRPLSPLPKPPSPRPLAASADSLVGKPMPRSPSPIPGTKSASTREASPRPGAGGHSSSFRTASPRPRESVDISGERQPSPLPHRDTGRSVSPRPNDRIVLGGTRMSSTNPPVTQVPKSPKAPGSPTVPRSSSTNELVQSQASRDSLSLVTSSPWIIDHKELTIGRKLGCGIGGVVYQGLWRDGDVAIKQLNRSAMSSAEVADFCKEAELMINLRPHTNVVRFLGFCLQPTLCIVTEFIEGGSLKEHLKQLRTPLDLRVIIKVLRSIAAGVNHLHREGIVHRDLAARNILTDKNLAIIRVSDFGLSRFLSNGDKGITTRNTGPLKWMAPECLSGREYSTRSDAYAFGVLAWEILTRSDPWPDLEPHTAAIRVMEHRLRLPIPADTPVELRTLLSDCWNESPSLRPDFSGIGARLLTLEAAVSA